MDRQAGKKIGGQRDQSASPSDGIDKARQKYCSYFTNTEFGVAKYYDVCLYSSVIGIDKCVDVICELAK